MSKKYGNIVIHSNIEEAAEAEALYISNQNPIDRIRETVQLILRVYSQNEKVPNTKNIYIDKE